LQIGLKNGVYSRDAHLLTKPWSKKNSLPVIFIFKFLEKKMNISSRILFAPSAK